MSDSDKHLIYQTLMAQLTEVSRGQATITQSQVVVMKAVSDNEARINSLCQTLHEQAMRDKEEESNQKVKYELAVQNCNHKGAVAEEAKVIALSAKKTAEKAIAMSGGKGSSSNKIAWGGLIAAIIGLLTTVTQWIAGMIGHH
jgi:hypothetical protein